MRIAVPHNTTKERARKIVDGKLQELLGQFSGHAEEMDHHWIGDTLRFKGKARGLSAEGTLEVTDTEIILDSKLPFIAKPFEGRIRQTVEREAESMFRLA